MKRSKSLYLSLLFLTCTSVLITANADADTDSENANLARIEQVLNSLTPLINAAEREQDPDARVQFHYDDLRRDIHKIKQGIEQKLQGTPIQPRSIQPIQGDYLTTNSKPV